MKAIIILLFSVASISLVAQETDDTTFLDKSKSEIRLDIPFLVFGEILQGSYERLLNKSHGLGFTIAGALNEDIDQQFAFIPYYRWYFGKEYARGFFFEANTVVARHIRNDFLVLGSSEPKVEETGWGVGFGIGGKWSTNDKFVVELVGGAYRILTFDELLDSVYPRFSIAIGHRF